MKPISSTARHSRSFPVVEFSYQLSSLTGYEGGCAKTVAPAFRDIGRHYFERDARRDFIREACLFALIIVTAAAPLFSVASALTEFCRAIGQF